MIYLLGLLILVVILFTNEAVANTFLLGGFVLGLIVTVLIMFG